MEKIVSWEDYKSCPKCGKAARRIQRDIRFVKNFSDNEDYEIIKETFVCLNEKCGRSWVVNVFGNPLKDYR